MAGWRRAERLLCVMKQYVTKTQAFSTMRRDAKGPVAPPPPLAGKLQAVADVVAAWPEVAATTHWHVVERERVDGVDEVAMATR